MLQQTQALAIQLAQQLDREHGTQLAANMAQQFAVLMGQVQPGNALPGRQAANSMTALGGVTGGESGVTRQARTRAANATAPR
jgi:hypothetical protein